MSTQSISHIEAKHPKVAYVLPVYEEAANIAAFHSALIAATEQRPDLEFEFVYVDDGSRDQSLPGLLALRHGDPRVSVLSLSRNFGHQVAVTAGLDQVGDADAVIVMDTDLQDPPRVSLEMIARWEDGSMSSMPSVGPAATASSSAPRRTPSTGYWTTSRRPRSRATSATSG